MNPSALLDAFVRAAFRDGSVRRDECSGDYLVTVRYTQRELAAARAAGVEKMLRRVRDELRPRPVRRRRLRWGRRKQRWASSYAR